MSSSSWPRSRSPRSLAALAAGLLLGTLCILEEPLSGESIRIRMGTVAPKGSVWAEELEVAYDRQPTDPAGFFAETDAGLSYLCRFKGTLSPADMREDLTFVPADSNDSYRKTVVRW